MKFDFKSLIPKWIAAGTPDTMEVDEAEAVASETSAEALERLRAASKPAKPDARIAELEAQLEAVLAEREEVKTAEAEAWFAAQVEAGKALPAEKDATLSVYAALHEDPAILASFKASVAARKPNGLTSESIPTDADGAKEFLEAGGFKVLPNAAATPDEAEAKESAARVKAMLAATDAGRDLAN